MPRIEWRRFRAFTLLELLVVLAIVALLLSILLPAMSEARREGMRTACLVKTRELGNAVGYFRADNDDRMPRSNHSAFAARAMPWEYALYRYFSGTMFESPDSGWQRVRDESFTCPFDDRKDRLSYGYNVYYELTEPETKGTVWRVGTRIPHPSTTILFGELEDSSATDHVMAHFWVQFNAPAEIEKDRHRPKASYVFVDGHAEERAFEQTYDDALGLDSWNPATAP